MQFVNQCKGILTLEWVCVVSPDGLVYQDVQSMCSRYQHHLTECATIIASEQRALASRLKDLEMFTEGVVQQMIRRQERMQRVAAHLQRG